MICCPKNPKGVEIAKAFKSTKSYAETASETLPVISPDKSHRVGPCGVLLRIVALLLAATVSVRADLASLPFGSTTPPPTTRIESYINAVSPVKLRYVGYPQSFSVPPNITSITVTLNSGSGGRGSDSGGRGAMISSIIPVIPDEVFMVVVGSAGQAFEGGYNGGGRGAQWGPWTGGGGATDLRRHPYSLADRILIAGGGGGTGYYDAYGGDGGVDPTSGEPAPWNKDDYGQAGGNTALNSTCAGWPVCAGPLGQGCNASGAFGGGGGGGYYGGGAGPSGGGGGGSSFSLFRVVRSGFNLGDGYAVIEW